MEYSQMEYDRLVKNVVEVLHVDPGELKPETTFVEDLGADSLDLFQILVNMEEELHVTVAEERLREVKTIGDALRVLTEQHSAIQKGRQI